MPAPQMFHGLARLAARAGFKLNAETGNPIETVDDTDRDDEGEVDDEAETTETETTEGETADGETTGGEETTDGDEDDDAGTGEDAPAGGTEASGNAPKRSADFRAGERHGAQQTAGRWAAVLSSPVGRANLEMATDLLATSTMSPAAIIGHCDRYKGGNAAKALLDTTTKVNLGVEGQTEADPAAAARANSVAKANARLSGGGRRGAKKGADAGGAPVRRSRRAAAAGTTPAK